MNGQSQIRDLSPYGAKLDHSRLLGFRNVNAVATATDDARKTAEFVFTKQGTETVA